MHRRTFLTSLAAGSVAAQSRFRLAIAGLVHGHANGFLRAIASRPDIELVGIAEPDDSLHASYGKTFGLPPATFVRTTDELLQRDPQAVAAFTSTYDHAEVVRRCAERRVAVMVEKPLAVSREHAQSIAEVAAKSGIPVVVNYETTWYRSHLTLWREIRDESAGFGPIRRMVAMDGHAGPKEIGVGPEFLRWLTDPVKNGAGALFDFGCYGANLMTWLMGNRKPEAVTARVQTFKPQIYSKVDDDATILLDYAGAQGVVQASWNWPYNRKDLEVYTERGYAHAIGGNEVRMLRPGAKAPVAEKLAEIPHDERDPLSYLVAAATGKLTVTGLSSLENNLIVTDILVAARESAKTGRTVRMRS